MRRFMTTILGVSALAAATLTPAMAQDDEQWSSYLFSSFDKQLVRVYLDGTTETYDLGIPEETFVTGRNMAFTNDGNTVAFCAPIMEGETTTHTVYVRDLEAGTNSVEAELGAAWDCRIDQEALDEEAGQLAVSTIGDEGWRIQVFDLTSGEVIQTLATGEENAPVLGNEADMHSLADVNHFENGTLIFALLPYGTEGPDEAPAFAWNFETGEASEVELWGKSMRDFFEPTGELAALHVNPDLEAGLPGGPMPSYNEVLVADFDSEAQTVMYSSEEIPTDLAFIEGGQRLAINLLEPFDMENPENMQTTRWVALDREGNTEELATPESYSQLANAPEGFVLLEGITADPNMGRYDMRLSYNSGGESTTLWYMEANEDVGGIFWELAWTAPIEAAEDLPPFAPLSE